MKRMTENSSLHHSKQICQYQSLFPVTRFQPIFAIHSGRHGSMHTAFALSIPSLEFWHSLAAQIAPGNDKLFFARKSGFGKLSRNTTPSHETIHRIVREFMVSAGIPKERICAQTLRNTYAASLIANGLSNAELAICLGLKSESSLDRLKAAAHKYYEKIAYANANRKE